MAGICSLNVPTNWNELMFEDYLKVLDIKELEGIDDEFERVRINILRQTQLISILTNKSLEEINNMKQGVVLKAIDSLSFLGKEIPSSTKVKFKPIEAKNVSYDTFCKYLEYSRSPNMISYLPHILSLFYKDLEAEKVMKMPTDEVLQCFFLLKRKLRRYWRISLFKTILQIIKFKIVETFWAKCNRNK